MKYILKIYFAGTASSALEVKRKRSDSERSESSTESSVQEEKVIRVFFSGCQEKRIGGKSLFMGYLSPDLNVLTQKLVRCFMKEDSLFFNVEQLKKNFSSSVIVEVDPPEDVFSLPDLRALEVSNIDLFGFSRGAVTSFLVARELNAFETDIEIYAEEPIPGESKMGFKKAVNTSTFLQKAYHLQDCQYIKKAKIVLGDHSHLDEPNIWYRQMSPMFHKNTQANIYLFSKNSHSFLGVFGEMQLSSYLLPDSVRVSALYHEQLTSLHLNKLCDYLTINHFVLADNGIEADNTVTDDELPSLAVNDLFFGHTLRSNFLSEPLFLPRPLKKSFHFGLVGRTQCAPSIKHWYQLKYQAFYLEPVNLRLKQVQALCFLCLNAWDKPQDNYPLLVNRILDESGNISENIGLRDFVVELGRTCNYFSKRDARVAEVMTEMLGTVLEQLEGIVNTDFSQTWHQVKVCMNEFLKSHKGVIGRDNYAHLVSSLKETLKTSALFNPTLVKFIKHLDDERMECDVTIAATRAFDDTPKTAFELTKNIFFSTTSRREITFNEYKNCLEALHTNLENVVDLSHLLNVEQGKILLKQPFVKSLISSLGTTNHKLFFIGQLPEALQSQVNIEPVISQSLTVANMS